MKFENKTWETKLIRLKKILGKFLALQSSVRFKKLTPGKTSIMLFAHFFLAPIALKMSFRFNVLFVIFVDEWLSQPGISLFDVK